MRNKRHEAILTLIKEQNIETQQELTVALASVGFDVTQATVSRDIKELRLVKKLNGDGNMSMLHILKAVTRAFPTRCQIFSDKVW